MREDLIIEPITNGWLVRVGYGDKVFMATLQDVLLWVAERAPLPKGHASNRGLFVERIRNPHQAPEPTTIVVVEEDMRPWWRRWPWSPRHRPLVHAAQAEGPYR